VVPLYRNQEDLWDCNPSQCVCDTKKFGSTVLHAGLSEQKKVLRSKKALPGAKKRSREHLSRALLRSVLFLAINHKLAEANDHTSYLSALLHHYCHHCAAADLSPTPPPTPPAPSPPAAAGQRRTPRCH
jgi:hypothetical protein